VNHRELPDYYNSADICVVPSHYESFGLVALESLACGTPVVATDVGEMKRIIRPGETGFVVPDNSPIELAEKIDGLLTKIDNEGTSAKAIRESVKDYDWSNVAESIARELYLVVNKERTPVA
jgi:D-inositol-3-phosphate glycosyltransferase